MSVNLWLFEQVNLDLLSISREPRFLGLDALISEVEDHIKDVGQENLQTILKSENVPTQFVEVMLNVHSKYHELIVTTFQVA